MLGYSYNVEVGYILLFEVIGMQPQYNLLVFLVQHGAKAECQVIFASLCKSILQY